MSEYGVVLIDSNPKRETIREIVEKFNNYKNAENLAKAMNEFISHSYFVEEWPKHFSVREV